MKTTFVYGHAVVETAGRPVLYTAALPLTGAGLAKLKVTQGDRACSPHDEHARRATEIAVARRRWILSTPGMDAPERFRRAFLVLISRSGAVNIYYATPDPAEQSTVTLNEEADDILLAARALSVPWGDLRDVAFLDAVEMARFGPMIEHGPGCRQTRATWLERWVHTAPVEVCAVLWRERGALCGGLDEPDAAALAAARERMLCDAMRATTDVAGGARAQCL